MDEGIIKELIKEAQEQAHNNFCCKHSNFTVGAVLLCASGHRYGGFNVENDGIQSICAERVAFVKALTAQEHDFKCIAVVGKDLQATKFQKTLPCGYCRQFMSEYVKPDFKIITYDEEQETTNIYTIAELLPESFSFKEE